MSGKRSHAESKNIIVNSLFNDCNFEGKPMGNPIHVGINKIGVQKYSFTTSISICVAPFSLFIDLHLSFYLPIKCFGNKKYGQNEV